MVSRNKGKILGGLVGFLIGILILVLGLFKTILLFICTVLGYYIGSRWDIDGDLKKLLDRLLPPKNR
ncbi:DUF2273 domain-containing protein [Halothermothrix orenii]|uniref:DUF2273 domain-containing protein n=1 Tax=Halothermothrix orenii TaxID=31909 RepID=UPI000682ABC5|nr:DUF2273 domain-containing protein [Halothermothrix orenii]